MSRTIRRKNETHEYYWILRDWIFSSSLLMRNIIDPQSNSGKKRLAKFHSDAGTTKCKEPGPKWFRNLMTERPQRRYAKNELRKFILDTEHIVILNSKDKLKYWT
jgi:hypothetical protein